MKNKRPLILVTNDDGINAKGLKELTKLVGMFGDVIVVAPEVGQSGMSHAITIKSPLILAKLPSSNGFSRYSCNGTPVDCVKLSLNKILDRKPDLIVSGINHGSNSSISVVYSGTMGATIEGCVNGIPSIGFSILDFKPDADFSLAIKYAKPIIKNVLENGLPKDTCLNVNFPLTEIKNELTHTIENIFGLPALLKIMNLIWKTLTNGHLKTISFQLFLFAST